MISVTTRLCGVIGDPISHSLSPVMHNAAMRHLGLDYAYMAFQVKPDGLQAAIDGMKAIGFAGLNVTIPHKVWVIPFLDEIDTEAKAIGAVNTIVNENGRLKGYNTDAGGFLQSVTFSGYKPRDKKVVLLGAGGAARAIGFALLRAGARITLLNRKEDFNLAVSLAQSLSEGANTVEALELNGSNLETALNGASLLVNATSVGMEPHAGNTPVPSSLLRPGLVVFDVVYAPLETKLLREARARGCTVVSGLEMLVRQGGLSFELWTSTKAPLDIMREAALSALDARNNAACRSESEAESLSKPKTSIALVGFMGSGKSTVGRALAQKLKKPFVDTDKLIEQKAGKTITRIFKEDGEPAFRELEREVISEVSGQEGQVIACGGGAVLNPSNVTNLKQNATIIYLEASEDEIQKRISAGQVKRPLLAGDKGMDKIASMMAGRRPLYERAADLTFDTTKSGIDMCVREIVKRLREYDS